MLQKLLTSGAQHVGQENLRGHKIDLRCHSIKIALCELGWEPSFALL